MTLLEVDALARHIPIRGFLGRRTGTVRAVDGVSFGLSEGEVLGIVGETGCGKSTLGKTIAGITAPTGGAVVLDGQRLGPNRPLHLRARLQYVYQDPGASLDPGWTVGRSLHEPLVIHKDWGRAERQAEVIRMAAAVGLAPALLERYPHEISGGQLRRVGLARILMLAPQIVIFDEPTASLDVTTQASVLTLMSDLRQRFNLTYILISHDIAVIAAACHRIAVMYLGRIVEIGPAREVLARPRHPYTRALLAAVPQVGGPRVSERLALLGRDLAPAAPENGCRFRMRCPIAEAACATLDPPLVVEYGHGAACLAAGHAT